MSFWGSGRKRNHHNLDVSYEDRMENAIAAHNNFGYTDETGNYVNRYGKPSGEMSMDSGTPVVAYNKNDDMRGWGGDHWLPDAYTRADFAEEANKGWQDKLASSISSWNGNEELGKKWVGVDPAESQETYAEYYRDAQNKGYDVSKLPTWDVIVDQDRTRARKHGQGFLKAAAVAIGSPWALSVLGPAAGSGMMGESVAAAVPAAGGSSLGSGLANAVWSEGAFLNPELVTLAQNAGLTGGTAVNSNILTSFLQNQGQNLLKNKITGTPNQGASGALGGLLSAGIGSALGGADYGIGSTGNRLVNSSIGGAANAALRGGNPLTGALGGGISGGVSGLDLGTGTPWLDAAGRGAISGGLNSMIRGGDAGRGALGGGFSGGMSGAGLGGLGQLGSQLYSQSQRPNQQSQFGIKPQFGIRPQG